MAWVFLDLLSRAASSNVALAAERAQFVSTLQSLREGLACSVLPGSASEVGKITFANAASDLLCQCRLLAAGTSNTYAGLEVLAAHVEQVLVSLKRGSLRQHEAEALARVLEVELGKFQ